MGDYIFVLIVLQIVVVVLMILVILLQPSNSDGVANFSSNSGILGVMSNKSGKSFLAKLTKWLATIFMLNSLLFTYLSYSTRDKTSESIIEKTITEQGNDQQNIKEQKSDQQNATDIPVE